MTKRPPPARRARTVTGASSVAAVLAMSGYLAVHHLESTSTSTSTKTTSVQVASTSYDGDDDDADDVATTTTTTTSTTIAAAQPATPSAVATTKSSGS